MAVEREAIGVSRIEAIFAAIISAPSNWLIP